MISWLHILNLCTYNAPARQWFRLHECDRCARRRWSTHTSQGYLLFREIIAKMCHDGCGGRGYSPGSRAPQSRKMPRYNPGATDVLVLSPT